MKHLLVCALVTLCASVATAQAVGDHCELTDETKLFLAKEGRKYSARLPKGAQVAPAIAAPISMGIENLEGAAKRFEPWGTVWLAPTDAHALN